MSSLQPFWFESQPLRVLGTWDSPWFVAKDVCEALEVGDHNQSTRTLDDDEKGLFTIQTLGGNQDVVCISESGLYSLVLRSRKPKAKKFKKWITSEVIPSIRKNGVYSMQSQEVVQLQPQQQVLPPASPLELFKQSLAAIEANHLEIQELKAQNQQLATQHLQLNDRVDGIERIQNQARIALTALPPASAEVPVKKIDDQVREIVNRHSAASGLKQDEVWRHLYHEFYYRFRRVVKKQKGESKLQAFVRLGLTQQLYDLALTLYGTKAA